MANYPYMVYQPQYGTTGYPVQMYSQPQQPQQNAPVLRLVTSKEEVISQQIPFDGSVSYFVDTSNGKIYTKAFDPNTGTAPISTYVKENIRPVRYATVDDLAALADSLRVELKPTERAVTEIE